MFQSHSKSNSLTSPREARKIFFRLGGSAPPRGSAREFFFIIFLQEKKNWAGGRPQKFLYFPKFSTSS